MSLQGPSSGLPRREKPALVSRRALVRPAACAALVIVMAATAACSSLGPYRDSGSTREPAPEPTVVPVDRTTAAANAPAAATPAPVPARPAPAPARILILRSSDSATYTEVSGGLDNLLGGRYRLQQISFAETDAETGMPEPGPGGWAAAVAIGAAAAEFAAAKLDIPTVFCQILDYAELLTQRDSIFGVEALPPLDLQIQSFTQLAPEVTSIGIVIAGDDAQLAAEAQRAAQRHGLELQTEFAGTDQEALYRFRRLTPAVDALWLLPSNDIMTPRMMQEVIRYAGNRGVHTIGFNQALLDWGALLTVGSDSADVAATVARVLDALVTGKADQLDRMTPLTKVDAQVNERRSAALTAAPPAAQENAGRTASTHVD